MNQMQQHLQKEKSTDLDQIIRYMHSHFESLCATCLINDFEKFVLWLHYNGLSRNTILSYLNDFKQSFKFFSQNRKNLTTLDVLTSMNINDFRELIASFSEKSARTQERLVAAWKKWCKFKEKDGTFIEFHKIQYPKVNKKHFVITDHAHIEKLLNLPCFNLQDYRMQAFITLLYSAGLRISEALNLRWVDIANNDNKFYFRVVGKGSKLRYVPALPVTIEKINQYKEHLKLTISSNFEHMSNQTSEYIFLGAKLKKWHPCAAEREFKQLISLLGLPKDITPHSLRHACATHLLKSGCNLRSIQALLGHSNLETTKLYIQYSTEELQKIHSDILK